MFYGPNLPDLARGAAEYVDKILRRATCRLVPIALKRAQWPIQLAAISAHPRWDTC
jgi:hypothetical protein